MREFGWAPFAPPGSDVVDAVSYSYGIPRDELLGPNRGGKSVARARQVGMWLCVELKGMSLVEAAAAFGRSNHTTSRNAWRRVEELRAGDPVLDGQLRILVDGLTGSGGQGLEVVA